MSEPLPPELDRLGDALARAADRKASSRNHRRTVLARLAGSGAAAVLAFTALHPGALGTAARDGGLQLASSSVAYVPAACDQPRGATFAAVRPCARPGATDVATDALARRYATH